MAEFPAGLRASFTDHGLLTDSAAGRNRIGLDGLLKVRGHRARRVTVPGAAVEGFRWRLRDVWNTTWWPQGIAPGDYPSWASLLLGPALRGTQVVLK